MKKYYPLIFLCVYLSVCVSCEKAEYSPNQVKTPNTPSELNRKNIERLLSTSSGNNQTIRIAYTGDSQRYYDDAVAFKDKVNSMQGIDMVILAGDITDFGLRQEFEWVNDIFSRLNVPYIGVIGNHDHGGNGEKTYRYMFGETDFSFVYKGVKFICHNTNGREYNFNGSVPDMGWMRQQLAPQEGVSNYIAVAHVPPYDDDFDKALEEPYTALFRQTPGFIVSLYGHRHHTTDSYPYGDSVRYINSNAIDQREFLLLEISDGKAVKTLVAY
jgi:Icc protein